MGLSFQLSPCYPAICLRFCFCHRQIKLLKILAVLGSGDKQASGHMYTVLGDIFKKGDTASNIGNAILYECICCISSIFPNPKMLVAAAETTSKFLKVCT
jgi:AP-4 complex subunit epsilon-1